jgi:hypothetical protein
MVSGLRFVEVPHRAGFTQFGSFQPIHNAHNLTCLLPHMKVLETLDGRHRASFGLRLQGFKFQFAEGPNLKP